MGTSLPRTDANGRPDRPVSTMPGRRPGRTGGSLWVRWASRAGVVAVALGVFVLLGELKAFNLPFVLAHLPEGIDPALLSLELTTLSFAIGFVLAMPLGLVRAFGPGAWPERTGRPWPFVALAVAFFGTIELALGGLFAFGLLGAYPVDPVEAYLGRAGDPRGTFLAITLLAALAGTAVAFLLRQVRAGRAPPEPRRSGVEPPPLSGSRAPSVARRSSASVDARDVGAVLRWPLYGFATGYVTAIRGTPFLVQVFVVYYAFIFTSPRFVFLGIALPFWAGLIALAINTTAYQAEALRGGFQSVERSQIEAARALGFGNVRIFFRITLPQSLRLVTLPLSNEWISTFKTSTILSYITVVELYFWARSDIAYQLSRPIEAFVILALFYLAINVTVSRSVSYVEKRYRIPGLGSMVPELPGRRGLLGDRG